MKTCFNRYLVFLVLSCGSRAIFAGTQEEHIVRGLYRCAAQAAPPTIQVRAIVRLTEPAWSKDQIEEQVNSQITRLHDERPETAQMIRTAVAAAHAGVRWLLYQETKLPGFYRLDIKDYYNVEPVIDDRLVYSNNVFAAYHINNYGRNDLPYKEMHWNNYGTSEAQDQKSNLRAGTVVIDNSTTPVVWSQKNLFLARQLEGQASIFFFLPLCKKLDPVMLQQVMDAARREDMALPPPLPLDEGKLHDLLNGRNPDVRVKIERGESPTAWVVEFSSHTDQGEGSARYALDENLPYLVSKTEIAGHDYKYTSERTGLAQMGFPSVWRTEQRRPDGNNTTKEIRILSVTTNVVLSAVLATNYPAGANVWEKTGDGSMKKMAPMTNQSPASQGPR